MPHAKPEKKNSAEKPSAGRRRNPHHQKTPPNLGKSEDDFVSVARRFGADESKERFEAKLRKIAKPTRNPK
jgi:hypothetical protein